MADQDRLVGFLIRLARCQGAASRLGQSVNLQTIRSKSELNGDGVAFDQRVGDMVLELFAVNIDDVAQRDRSRYRHQRRYCPLNLGQRAPKSSC